MYSYKGKIVSVYDGDTVRANVDLGFGVINKGSDGKGMPLRLARIDTPEMRGAEKEEGKKARDYVRGLILNKDVEIHTVKDKTGKFGRYIAEIYIDGENINDKIVADGYAKYYD